MRRFSLARFTRLSAATVARSVQGVRSVTNDIEIESADRHASAD